MHKSVKVVFTRPCGIGFVKVYGELLEQTFTRAAIDVQSISRLTATFNATAVAGDADLITSTVVMDTAADSNCQSAQPNGPMQLMRYKMIQRQESGMHPTWQSGLTSVTRMT